MILNFHRCCCKLLWMISHLQRTLFKVSSQILSALSGGIEEVCMFFLGRGGGGVCASFGTCSSSTDPVNIFFLASGFMTYRGSII
jgi:hypothetical protein